MPFASVISLRIIETGQFDVLRFKEWRYRDRVTPENRVNDESLFI